MKYIVCHIKKIDHKPTILGLFDNIEEAKKSIQECVSNYLKEEETIVEYQNPLQYDIYSIQSGFLSNSKILSGHIMIVKYDNKKEDIVMDK